MSKAPCQPEATVSKTKHDAALVQLTLSNGAIQAAEKTSLEKRTGVLETLWTGSGNDGFFNTTAEGRDARNEMREQGRKLRAEKKELGLFILAHCGAEEISAKPIEEMESTQRAIDTLKAEHGTLTKLQKDITASKAEAQGLASTKSQLGHEIGVLTTSKAKLEGMINSMQSTKNELSAEFEALQSTYDKFQSEVDNLQLTKGTFQTRARKVIAHYINLASEYKEAYRKELTTAKTSQEEYRSFIEKHSKCGQ